jgi:hypothetical protein
LQFFNDYRHRLVACEESVSLITVSSERRRQTNYRLLPQTSGSEPQLCSAAAATNPAAMV